MRTTILIADDNTAFQTSLKEYFSQFSEFEVVGTASDGLEATSLIEKLCPDFVLLDIVMPELDGFGVLSALSLDHLEKKPAVIMMSQLSADGFVSKALRMGASYFLAKPFSFNTMKRFLEDYGKEDQTSAPQQPQFQRNTMAMAPARTRVISLDEKIASIFISVGIPAHIKGYQFLREAIKLAVASPDIINSITKRLYPSIAEHFDTSPSKVERAIRHAIEVAWNRGKIENINNIFGIKVYSANEKPTNGEFIALVADKMLLEGA
ncbi:MAG: sporulation transcription factor Spo0A [Clostridia bacterium]|nr:sporulation transcription factor Spo0A [Clostridia bacterium]